MYKNRELTGNRSAFSYQERSLDCSTPAIQNRACWGPRCSTPAIQNRACWGPRCARDFVSRLGRVLDGSSSSGAWGSANVHNVHNVHFSISYGFRWRHLSCQRIPIAGWPDGQALCKKLLYCPDTAFFDPLSSKTRGCHGSPLESISTQRSEPLGFTWELCARFTTREPTQ